MIYSSPLLLLPSPLPITFGEGDFPCVQRVSSTRILFHLLRLFFFEISYVHRPLFSLLPHAAALRFNCRLYDGKALVQEVNNRYRSTCSSPPFSLSPCPPPPRISIFFHCSVRSAAPTRSSLFSLPLFFFSRAASETTCRREVVPLRRSTSRLCWHAG